MKNGRRVHRSLIKKNITSKQMNRCLIPELKSLQNLDDSGDKSIEQTYFEGSFYFSLHMTLPVTRYIQMVSYRIVRSYIQNGLIKTGSHCTIFSILMFLNIMRGKSHNTPTALAFFLLFLSVIWLCTTDTLYSTYYAPERKSRVCPLPLPPLFSSYFSCWVRCSF